MRSIIKRSSQALVVGAGVSMGLMRSASATVDTAAITAAATDIAAVGAAVFAVVIGVKVWKWLKAAA